MADRILINQGVMDGEYNGLPFTGSTSSVATVRLASVPFTKTADQEIWFGGPLTFTITVDNTGSESEGPLENLVITDQIDTTMFYLDQSSIEIMLNSVELVLGTDYTVAYVGGLLTITFANTVIVATNDVLTITFQGSKVP